MVSQAEMYVSVKERMRWTFMQLINKGGTGILGHVNQGKILALLPYGGSFAIDFSKTRMGQALPSSHFSGQMGSFPRSSGGELRPLTPAGSGTCLMGQLTLCGLRT